MSIQDTFESPYCELSDAYEIAYNPNNTSCGGMQILLSGVIRKYKLVRTKPNKGHGDYHGQSFWSPNRHKDDDADMNIYFFNSGKRINGI